MLVPHLRPVASDAVDRPLKRRGASAALALIVQREGGLHLVRVRVRVRVRVTNPNPNQVDLAAVEAMKDLPTDILRSITSKQGKLISLFLKWDKDGNGRVDRAEMLAALTAEVRIRIRVRVKARARVMVRAN